GCERRQFATRRGAGHCPGNALPATAGLRRAGLRSRPLWRQDCPFGRQVAGAHARGKRLRLGARGRERMSTATIDTALLERAVARLPGDSLARARKEALARFATTGFPTTRHEDWRYTNLTPAIDVSNAWLRRTATGALEEGSDESV